MTTPNADMTEVALTLLDAGAGEPPAEQFQLWLQTALDASGIALPPCVEVTIQIVDQLQSAELNEQFRGKSGATNVLSFPFSAMTPEPLPILGDLAICAPLVVAQAQAQGKTALSHWAHLTVHGLLHLCGYDHIEEPQAEAMESLERQIMAQLGFADPYLLPSQSA
jgi:probable rRNA maturation factor